MGRTWLRAPGITDDSACAMVRNAARSSENARDPPRRRERLEIRSLADSQALLYFIRLSRETRKPEEEQNTHQNKYIGVLLKKKLSRHCAYLTCDCDYAKFSPLIEVEFHCAKISYPIGIFSVVFFC